jgi:hypothetical protein
VTSSASTGDAITLSVGIDNTGVGGSIALSTGASSSSSANSSAAGGSITLTSGSVLQTMSGSIKLETPLVSPYKACRRKEGCFRIFERQLRCMSMYAI